MASDIGNGPDFSQGPILELGASSDSIQRNVFLYHTEFSLCTYSMHVIQIICLGLAFDIYECKLLFLRMRAQRTCKYWMTTAIWLFLNTSETMMGSKELV